MSRPKPTLFTIPAGVSFVDALAAGLLERAGPEPGALAGTTLLLPTRRACRALAEAFLEASGGTALLLPRLLPLGDLDAEELSFLEEEAGLAGSEAMALPPAMPGLRRQLLLSLLIQAWQARRAEAGTAPAGADQAARLAEELARLIDQVETEGLSWNGLAGLVPEDYAGHWQETLDFLEIVTARWPEIEAEQGAVGPAARRRLLLERQAAAWQAAPPAGPVVVAGSTGSIPATAALIAAVAALPEGMVVLPGLDRSVDEETWEAVAQDPAHPQHGLARLLLRLGAGRDEVADWPHAAPEATIACRGAFLNDALRPAALTAAWSAAEDDPDGGAGLEAALAGVRRIDCANPAEEALVVALLLRQSLRVPGRSAALVTPDRGLARRVAAELRRWDIEIDDSAGQPLSQTPPGAYLRLTADLLVSELAPLPLLAALKHPLTAGGEAPGAFRDKVRALELAVLRGPRPAPGFTGLRAALAGHAAAERLRPWLDRLAAMAEPFRAALAARPRRLKAVAEGHLAFAEALAASDKESGPARLWAGEAGEAAAGFADELLDPASGDAGAGDPGAGGLEVGREDYVALLDSLMAGRAVRPRYGRHPRLAILGPLEARLKHADVMILAGLNEGTWPAETDSGPWLSRPMRAAFGLPAPERRIGLSAHDFLQACAAPEVALTRSTRVEGAPTVPSRWLLRIDALLRARGLGDALHRESGQWCRWAAELDRPPRIAAAAPPEPRPPVAKRPHELSVTEVQSLVHDPYGLYARKVLALAALDPLDADPGAAERGTLIHAVLERFVARFPENLPEDALEALLALGREAFAPLEAWPSLHAFWWPRFERIAAWFVAWEAERRPGLAETRAELRGRLALDAPAGLFTLKAKADRLERRRDGGLTLIDYKTGALPTGVAVETGLAPQLPLEAAIAAAGGFAALPAGAPDRLAFLRLTGGEPAGAWKPLAADAAALAAEARAGLERLVAAYDRPETAYRARPYGGAPGRDPYALLSRLAEWSSGAGGEDGP